MQVTLLCSDIDHPIMPVLKKWSNLQSQRHQISIVHKPEDLEERGDILFLVSCTEYINAEKRSLFKYCLVLHASDLPFGRGWSPHVWAILSGSNELTVTLLEASDRIDAGRIYHKQKVFLDGSELYDEVNSKLFDAELSLINWACDNIFKSAPVEQPEILGLEMLPRRTPADSELDINKSIKDQFNLLRISDPHRYPAFLKYKNQKFKIFIERMGNAD